MKQKNLHAEPWKEFAVRWKQNYTPPGQPSKPDIEVYKTYVMEAAEGVKHTPKALVLGATPQLRDLLMSLGYEVTIVDVNMEMILAMTELVTIQNPHEVIVRADWSDLPLRSEQYDIVVGDLVIPNMQKEKEQACMSEIYRVLKPDGSCITRLYVNTEAGPSFEKVLTLYEQAPIAHTRSHEMFTHLLVNVAYDQERRLYDVSRIKEAIEPYLVREGVYKHPSEKITEYMNKMWMMWKPMNKQWTSRTRDDYLQLVEQRFSLQASAVAGTCHYRDLNEIFPIWLMRKK